MKKQKELQKLREQLYFDDRTKTVPKSTIKNHIIEDIVKDGDLFIKNRELMDQI